MRYKSTPEQFFARLVERPSGCRDWPGPFMTRGLPYGKTKYRGRTVAAHVLSWMFVHGLAERPELWVLHTCDRPQCCEPTHLWLGTAKQNSEDRDAKGRNGTRVISSETVTAMRVQRERGASLKEIAERFGVSDTSVGVYTAGIESHARLLRRDVQARLARGERQIDIARALGKPRQYVWLIAHAALTVRREVGA